MVRLRVLSISLLIAGTAASALASVPELDPGSAGAGIAAVVIGGLYLIERFRRRR